MFNDECLHCHKRGVLVRGWTWRFTLTGSSIRGHGVAIFRTSALVAAFNINALESAHVSHVLGTLIDICVEESRIIERVLQCADICEKNYHN